jgi:phosphoglycerate dehydrogenase-like enzyme
MSEAKIIVAPHFRRMAEIFDPGTLERLRNLGAISWGRDGPMPQAEMEAALVDATAVVFGTWEYGRDAIPAAGDNLRYVFEVAGSHAHKDLNYRACLERSIRVGGCAPAFGPAVAEMGLALALAAGRLVGEGDAAFRTGQEKWLHEGTVGAVTTWGKTIGFVGAGGLAVSLQQLLTPFQTSFVAYDPWLGDEVLRGRGIEPLDLPELFAISDFIYVLANPTPDNYQMIDAALMRRLRPHQTLVLLSRAHLVDFEALTDLLLEGRFRAAIDVWPSEPFDPHHRIRTARNAVFSAHRAGAIPEALLEIGRMVVHDLEKLLRGDDQALRLQYATPELVDRLHPAGGDGRAGVL